MEDLSFLEIVEDVTSWYNTFWIVCAMVTLFLFVGQNILITRFGCPKSLGVGENQFWLWRNTIISGVHALIAGVWTLYSIAAYDELRSDPIDFLNPSAFALVVFSTTYFMYDLTDQILNQKVLQNWEVSLHHVAVSSTFLYNLSIRKCIGYTIYALLTEVNSTFLHIRRLLKIMKFDHNGLVYRINALVNIVTCAVFRGAPTILVPSGYYYHPVVEKLGVPYFFISIFSVVTLSVIQIFLFFRLLKSDYGHHRSRATKQIITDVDNNDIKIHSN